MENTALVPGYIVENDCPTGIHAPWHKSHQPITIWICILIVLTKTAAENNSAVPTIATSANRILFVGVMTFPPSLSSPFASPRGPRPCGGSAREIAPGSCGRSRFAATPRAGDLWCAPWDANRRYSARRAFASEEPTCCRGGWSGRKEGEVV